MIDSSPVENTRAEAFLGNQKNLFPVLLQYQESICTLLLGHLQKAMVYQSCHLHFNKHVLSIKHLW